MEVSFPSVFGRFKIVANYLQTDFGLGYATPGVQKPLFRGFAPPPVEDLSAWQNGNHSWESI